MAVDYYIVNVQGHGRIYGVLYREKGTTANASVTGKEDLMLKDLKEILLPVRVGGWCAWANEMYEKHQTYDKVKHDTCMSSNIEMAKNDYHRSFVCICKCHADH